MNIKSFPAVSWKFYNVKRSCRDMYSGILLWLRKRFVAENCIICPLYTRILQVSMKLNDRKFGKIFAEPNLPKSAEPRNFGRFLVWMMWATLIQTVCIVLRNKQWVHTVTSSQYRYIQYFMLYISRRQLPRIVITVRAGYIFWQLFLWRL